MNRQTHRYSWPSILAVVLLSLAGCDHTTAQPQSTPAVTAQAESQATAKDAFPAACQWLWKQQAADGGWHSETYALLRSGQSLTPFILHSLLQVPETICPRPTGAVQRALDFIRNNTNDKGIIGMQDPDVLDYPNYSTSYALGCLLLAGNPSDKPIIEKMGSHLVSQQYQQANGFTPSHLAFGGWGFGGPRPDGDPGHMDLAHTRRALEAIRLAGVLNQQIFARAEDFLRLVQRHPDDARPQPTLQPVSGVPAAQLPFDGGFYFSPVVLNANKGREESDSDHHYFRSYASATCDGILALLAAGVDKNDARITQARDWLDQHPSIEYPAGVPTDHPDPWGEAIHFYHLAVRAEAYDALEFPGDWRQQIIKHLAKAADARGSFHNSRCHLMKEDDPLLCTTLAVIAFSHCASPLKIVSE